MARRVEYAQALASLVVAGAPIIYMDETSVHVWMKKERCWQPMDSPVNVPLNKTRHKGLTVFGAIGACLVEPVMMLGDRGTNAEDFVKFLKLVVAQIAPGSQKPYLVIDNASAHLGPDAKEFISKHFVPFNVPAYSCQFNSIEHLWSVLKANIKKLLFSYPEHIDEQTWRDMIYAAWFQIEPSVFEAMVGSNR